jgi:hypothetical protein
MTSAKPATDFAIDSHDAAKWRAHAAEFLIPPQTAEELRDKIDLHDAADDPYWELWEAQWDGRWLYQWQRANEPLTSIVALSTGFEGEGQP